MSQMYLNAGTISQGGIDAIRTFFNSLAALLPVGLTITVPSVGDLVDDDTGGLAGSWSVGVPPAVVTGTAAGNYAGQSGAVVHWLTTGIAGKRRVRGRTYLVPLIATAYDSTGSLAAGSLTTLQNAATALIGSAGPDLRVWHRPKKATATEPALPGSSFAPINARVPDLVVTMRSRRT